MPDSSVGQVTSLSVMSTVTVFGYMMPPFQDVVSRETDDRTVRIGEAVSVAISVGISIYVSMIADDVAPFITTAIVSVILIVAYENTMRSEQ